MQFPSLKPRFNSDKTGKKSSTPHSTKELMVQSKSKANKRIGEAPGRTLFLGFGSLVNQNETNNDRWRSDKTNAAST